MNITINGEKRQIKDSINVKELLDELKITGPVAVELNRQICPKAGHQTTTIKEDDTLEIVTIVGGG